jgi:DNA-binding XRE family transcriptional regulator
MTNYLGDFRMNIKYYREKLEISQARLSIICDCCTGTIGGIESAKAKPSFDMMIKIAEALKVTPADLFIRDISKTKAEIKKEIKNQVEIMLAKI